MKHLSLKRYLTLSRSFSFLSKFLTVFSFLAMGQVFAQTRHLVVDLENVLIQQIPYRNFQNFQNKAQMFQVSAGGKYFSFYLHLQAKEWILSLQNRKDVVIDVLSDRDLATTKLILEAIKDSKFKNSELFSHITSKGKVLTLEDKVNNAHDLSKIDSQLNNVVFIGHDAAKIQSSQKSRFMSLGEDYYKFESWAEAKKAYDAAAAADKVHFPATEAEWSRESKKIAILGFLFKSPLFSTDPGVLLSGYQSKAERHQAIGAYELGEAQDKSQTFWNLSDDKKTIVGCETVDLSKNLVTKSLTPADCVKVKGGSRTWKVSQDRSKVDACVVTSGAATAVLAVDDCLDDKVNTYWKGKTKGMCSYFTEDLIFIADKGAVGCGEQHVLRHPDNGTNQVILYFKGMEAKTEKEIFASPPPTASEPFRLYAPYDVDKKVGFTVKDCQDAALNNHPVKLVNGELPENCRPDVLYSWGPLVKIQDLKKSIGDGGTWSSSVRAIFASRSPVSTFGYGEYSIRLKFKKGVKWVNSGVWGCNPAAGPIVYFKAWGPGLDYGFCNPDVLESWSYGTAEHYDEIVKDYLWMSNPKTPSDEIETYANRGFQDMIDFDWDSHTFSLDFLKLNLGRLQKLINDNKGEIFYNPNSKEVLNKRVQHFKTDKPIYFNER